MAFGDIYKTAWRNEKKQQVCIIEGSSTDETGVSFAYFFGKHGEVKSFLSRPKSLNAARAMVAMFARGCGWHADMKVEIGLFNKDGHELPDPDEAASGGGEE